MTAKKVPKYRNAKTESLIPYARNSRTHSKDQISQIASSIKEFGFTNPILIDELGGIIAGHGRLLAAQKLGMDEVPVIELSYLTEAQKKAYIIADNKLALNAGWDEEMLKIEFEELKALDFDLDLTGFDDKELNKIFGIDDDNPYTKKVDIPIYEPSKEKPKISDLYDEKKALLLAEKIQKLDIPTEEREFLVCAAYRHVEFNFEQIANYYAHSSPKIQRAMEDSALVIIDFNKAIENGYVRLSKDIYDKYEEDRQDIYE